MAYETILYDQKDAVATITLNRPQKLNAYNAVMGREVHEAAKQADADPQVRAIIMTGAGRAFCAGADIRGFDADLSQGGRGPQATEKPTGPTSTLASNLTLDFLNLSKPVIAAINGYALGVGCTIPMLADIRIAADTDKMGFIFPRVGVITELGSSFLLPRMVGLVAAAEILLTGKQFTAQEMKDLGFITHVVPGEKLMETARGIAGEIIKCAPLSVAYTRRALYESLEAGLTAMTHFEREAFRALSYSADHNEYVRAFVEKREPHFTGR